MFIFFVDFVIPYLLNTDHSVCAMAKKN